MYVNKQNLLIMENNKKKKRRNKIILGIGIATLALIGGVVLYKKCPKAKKIVDLGASKVGSLLKKKVTKTETADQLPSFRTKPRQYKTYNGKNI